MLRKKKKQKKERKGGKKRARNREGGSGEGERKGGREARRRKGKFHSPWIKVNTSIPDHKKKKTTKTVRQEKAPQTTSFGIQISVKSNLEKCGETTAKR